MLYFLNFAGTKPVNCGKAEIASAKPLMDLSFCRIHPEWFLSKVHPGKVLHVI
jgi:hypothetical protein